MIRRYACDRNYGRLGGWLVSIIGETAPGYWQLLGAQWFPWHPWNLLAGL
jgi:hypothetical protein